MNCRIQQIDGGFFEKFGSLLREHSVLAAEKDHLEREQLAADAAEITKIQEETEERDAVNITNEAVQTQDSEEGTSSSDSEPEEPEITDYVAVGWNVSILR